VVREARDARLGRALDDDQIQNPVAAAQWIPRYLPRKST
jgi:hypothetical protein